MVEGGNIGCLGLEKERCHFNGSDLNGIQIVANLRDAIEWNLYPADCKGCKSVEDGHVTTLGLFY